MAATLRCGHPRRSRRRLSRRAVPYSEKTAHGEDCDAGHNLGPALKCRVQDQHSHNWRHANDAAQPKRYEPERTQRRHPGESRSYPPTPQVFNEIQCQQEGQQPGHNPCSRPERHPRIPGWRHARASSRHGPRLHCPARIHTATRESSPDFGTFDQK